MNTKNIVQCENAIRKICLKYKYIFLYGAGQYGNLMYRFLKNDVKCQPIAYCVSKKDVVNDSAVPILELKDISYPLEQCGFIFSLKESYQEEVQREFLDKDIKLNVISIPNDFFCYLKYLQDDKLSYFFPWEKYDSLQKYIFGKSCVLIKREAGLGDVLAVEPIIRKLKALGYCIFFETNRPELFLYNDDIVAIFKPNVVPDFVENQSLVINLNGAYENKPLVHILDGYINKVQELWSTFQLSDEERIPIYDKNLIRHLPYSDKIKKICVNSEGSWLSRTYDRKKMVQFIKYLQENNYSIYEIGCDKKNYLGIGKMCYGMKLHDTVELMSHMDLYIGMDGGLMHFAQAIHLPIFVIFGCTCPNFRIHDWARAKVLWKNTDELSCAGCHHRRKAPRNFTECDRYTIDCLDWTVEEVIESFETAKFNDPPELKAEIYNPL